MPSTSGPRVRFAPSPTGFLHVGGARTALYNLLFARREKGTYVLRIEDTDVERSSEEMSGQILSALDWLGLEHDEGPYYQSRRYDLYREAAERLIAEGKAYRAFETSEELDLERKRAEAEGRSYRYSGAGREISPDESDRRARAGEKFVVRLKMPAELIVVDDLIRGRVEFPAEALDDFVLVRSDGHPLYHFCVCVDDADMRITHVLRGDDHLANTPKHVALFRALGADVPEFAHLGMILGTDRKKLSKRYGAAAVEEWREQGIFPEALVNFLALLGWSPGDDREILSREVMEREFSLDRIGASPSVFDPEKLLWLNAQYMARLPAEELLRRAKPHAPSGLPDKEAALAAVELHRTRARTAIEMGRALSMYAVDPEAYDPEGLRKHVRPETAAELERLMEAFEKAESWTAQDLDAALRQLAGEMKIPASRLIHPVRLALTGVTVGAPLFDVVALLGKETALGRLRKFVEKIRRDNTE
ncbi:MAG TPA: glutamate--tRNA ligase [Thermoanaerobaculia bacterium]|nr:glutamate--tRNA ligase [Thermoanaerobaculia bacterium]